MIRFRRIKLKNFLSHEDTEITFSDGTYIIVGNNASGKTSILRGLFYAVFGEDVLSHRANLSRLIKFGRPYLETEVDFEIKGQLYTVKRKLSVSKKNVKSQALLIKSGKLLVHGASEVATYLKELGLTAKNFKDTSFVPQGEIFALVQAQPRIRKEVLNRLLGMEDAKKKFEKLKLLKDRIESELGRLVERKKNLQERVNKLPLLQREFLEKNGQIKKLSPQVVRLEERIKELDLQISELEKLSVELKELDKLALEIKKLRSQIREVESMKKKISSLQSSFEMYAPLIELKELVSELKDTRVKLEEFRKRQVLLGEKEKLEAELEGKLKEFESLKDKLSNLSSLKNTFERKKAELSAILKEVEKLQTLSASLSPLKSRLSEVSEKFQNSRRAKEKLEALKAEIKRLLDLAEEKRQSIAALSTSNSQCPVCGSKLDGDKKKELLKSYREALASYEEKLRQLKEKALRLEREAKDLEGLEKEVSLLKAQVQSAEDRLRELPSLKERKEQLKREIRELESVLKQYSEVEREASEVDKRVKFIQARIGLIEREFKDGSEIDGDALVEKEEKLLEKISEIKKRLGLSVSNSKELDRLLRRVSQERDEYLRLKAKVEGEALLKETLEEKVERFEQIKQKTAGLSSESLLAQLKELKAQREALSVSYREKSALLHRLSGEVSQIEREIEGLKEDEKNLSDTEKDVLKFNAAMNELELLLERFHPSRGYYHLLRAALSPQIAKVCGSLFEKFGFEATSVSITQELDIRVSTADAEFDFEQLSGGQKVALALALRFALAQVLSFNFESIILDEPTIHLDSQRKAELIELLSQVKTGVPQMIIVTHDPEFESVADVVVRVKKLADKSIVEF